MMRASGIPLNIHEKMVELQSTGEINGLLPVFELLIELAACSSRASHHQHPRAWRALSKPQSAATYRSGSG
jgi:hypothetical protein